MLVQTRRLDVCQLFFRLILTLIALVLVTPVMPDNAGALLRSQLQNPARLDLSEAKKAAPAQMPRQRSEAIDRARRKSNETVGPQLICLGSWI